MKNSRLTPHQAEVLRRIEHDFDRGFLYVAAARRSWHPAGTVYVGSAGALAHLAEKGRLRLAVGVGTDPWDPIDAKVYELVEEMPIDSLTRAEIVRAQDEEAAAEIVEPSDLERRQAVARELGLDDSTGSEEFALLTLRLEEELERGYELALARLRELEEAGR